MGLTERHWFENEEPELTERQLEDIVYENKKAYDSGYVKGFHDAKTLEQEATIVISIYRNGFGSRIGACPNCKRALHYEYNQSFCGKCGQAVRWE